MSTSRVKKSFLRQVKVNDIIEELKADNYFLKSHNEMIACVKDTLAYKQMREVAIKHMFNTLSSTSQLPDAETREEKKNQIGRIGHLAIQISSAISKTISEKLNQEATDAAKKALKKLSYKRERGSNSLSNGRKRKQNEAFFNEENVKVKEEDEESEVSLDSISESVSSVHTSDLSSFDDEIVVSSEDEKGARKEKCISFKTANKAYFNDGFSNIHDVISHQKSINGKKACKKSKTEEKSSSGSSEKLTDSKNRTSRPKRERKPNSRYSD